jgi:hypothetical protein
MVTLMIEQFKTELQWLRKVARELPRRASAKNPEYAGAPETCVRPYRLRKNAKSVSSGAEAH